MKVIVNIIWIPAKHECHRNYNKNADNKLVAVRAPIKPTSIDLVLEVIVDVEVLKVVKVDIVELVEPLLLLDLDDPLLLHVVRFNIDVVIALHPISAKEELHQSCTLLHFVESWPFFDRYLAHRGNHSVQLVF